MKWEGRRESSNIEDIRGSGGGGGLGGLGGLGGMFGGRGGGIRIPMGRSSGGGGLGIGGIVILGLIAWFVFGINPLQLLGGMMGGGGSYVTSQSDRGSRGSAADDRQKQFVGVVLADTEDVWHALLEKQGMQYREPRLVLFSGQVQSDCGGASAAMGPFYCPLDEKVYIDLAFFDELAGRFGAAGDFAQAYVIAHEVGHHVQTLTGLSAKVEQMRAGASKEEANALSVRQELQADCYAGVWAANAQRTKAILDPGDIDEALTAAASVGDDTIQRKSGGAVVPESFTHGTSAQRQRWFRAGFDSGDMKSCDTFGTDNL